MMDNYLDRIPLEMVSHWILGGRKIGSSKILANFFSPFSLKKIQERASSSKDAEAMLKLGDWYMYGLKSLPRDQAKAKRLYEQAAELGSPEARTQCAEICYWEILNHLDLKDGTPIPSKMSYGGLCRVKMQTMWEHLEQAAEVNYITPFMLNMDVDAQHTHSWTSSPNLKRRIEKKLNEQNAEYFVEIREDYKVYLNESKQSIKLYNSPHSMKYNFGKGDMCFNHRCYEIYVYEHFDYGEMLSEVKRLLNFRGKLSLPKGITFCL
jgi:hypothetical protein